MHTSVESSTAGGPLPSPSHVEAIKAAAEAPLPAQSVEPGNKHFKDWPNDLGFNYLPQTNEPVSLKVTGAFPTWTAGSLLRIGPGAYKVPSQGSKDGIFKTDHWFDGFSTCHKFEIRPSNASTEVVYSSRGLVDGLVEKARKTGKLSKMTFGQKYDPCDSFYRKLKTMFQPESSQAIDEDNVGVSFAPSHHRSGEAVISITTDRNMLKEIDLESLEAKTLTSQKDLHPKLDGPLSAAHPCVDPVTSDVYNYNLSMGAKHVYHIFRTSARTGKTEVITSLSGSDITGSYIHSAFLTEHFYILCIWPAFYANKGIDILWKRNILQAIAPFDASAKCTWLVVDRAGPRGLVKKFSSPAMFAFHTVNAWEENTSNGEVDIVADVCQFENLDILHKLYYENLVSNGSSVQQKPIGALTRYQLNRIPVSSMAKPSTPEQAKVLWSLQEPKCGELPTMNPAYYTKPYRYVYSIISHDLSSFVDSIGKTDTKTGECKHWSVEKHTPGEPIFIQRPGAVEEDDGVLLVVVLDGINGTSYLLCLDARNLTEVARADVPVPVGFGFHGIHLAKAGT